MSGTPIIQLSKSAAAASTAPKIQLLGAAGNLIEKEITANGEYPASADGADGFSKVVVNIPIPECSGKHVIEITEPPAVDDLDKTAIYKYLGSYFGYVKGLEDIFVVDGSDKMSLVELYSAFGVSFNLYYAETKPTENIVITDPNVSVFNVYYIAGEDDLFVYGDVTESGTNEWASFTTLMGMPNNGAISDTSEATEDGVYAVVADGWKEYLAPKGSVTITENSTVDVTDKASVIVEVEPTLQSKSVTANGTVTPDSGYDGLSSVNVNVPIPAGYIQPSGSLEITENSTVDVTEKAEVVVNVPIPTIIEAPSEITANGTYTASQMGADGISKVTVNVKSESEGLTLNGIIREYEVNAGASVSAGDFVEFVNKCGAGEFHTGTTNYLSACKLDNSRVLVAYQDGGNSSYGTAAVLTIDDTKISMGAEFVFNNSTTSYISVCALTDSKAVVAYSDGSNSSASSAIVLTIDGTNISAGEKVNINSIRTLSTAIVGLTESKALVFTSYYNWATSCYGMAYLLTINGTTISVSSSKAISSSGKYCQVHRICASKITDSSVIFSYEQMENSNASYCSDYLRAGVLAIDESNNLSVGSIVDIAKSTSGSYANSRDFYSSLCVLNENKALIVYNRASDNFLCGEVLSISGLAIGRGSATAFTEQAITQSYISVAALSETKALVAYYGSAVVLTIDGTTISAGTAKVFNAGTTEGSSSGTYKSVIPFSANSALVVLAAGTGKYASLSIADTTITVNEASGTFVEKATSNLHNVGIAKTSGAEGETVEVYCAV